MCCRVGRETVEVSILSRPFLTNEATKTSTANGFNYKCAQGDTSRTVIQQKIAMNAIVLAVAPNGSAAYCLQHLYSNGLTLEQLRFLYSSYTVAQLLNITSLSPTNSPSVNIGPHSTPVLPSVKPTLAPLPPYSMAPGKVTMPPITLMPVFERPTAAPSVATPFTQIPTFISTDTPTRSPVFIQTFRPTPRRRTQRPTIPKRSLPSWLFPKIHQHRDSEVAASAYCSEIQALVAGPPTTSDIFQQFVEKILPNYGSGDENVTPMYYPADSVDKIVRYLQKHTNAIAFVSLADYAAYKNKVITVSVTNKNGKNYVPNPKTVKAGQYPLVYDIYMGVRSDDPATLRLLRPFFAFAYSPQGDADVSSTGLVHVPDYVADQILSRLNASNVTH